MKAIALHEAGHCVVGHSFGWAIEEMRITAGDSGSVRWSNSESTTSHWCQSIPRARRDLCVSVAGYVAERCPISARLREMFKGQHRLEPSDEDEYKSAFTAFAIHKGSRPKKGLLFTTMFYGLWDLELSEAILNEIERSEKRAEKILKKYRVELTSLAEVLQEKEFLNGSQIRRVLNRASGDRV